MKLVSRLLGPMLAVALMCGFATSASALSGNRTNLNSDQLGLSQISQGWRSQTASVAVFAALDPLHERDRHKKRVTVPEGGSALLYLGLAGMACLGAVVWRSRWHASRKGSA
jgi:hypothetical protein